jgi:uncharacterized protein (DUF1015 family)
LGGIAFQRYSFVALAKLAEFGQTVRAHEHTMSKPKIDRLNLKKATAAGFGLIFALYEDPENIADKIIQKTTTRKPLVNFTDEQNVCHQLFVITEQNSLNAIVEMMRDKYCIIADGHHRYETALTYRKQTDNPEADYLMMAFANISHSGLAVLATHRLVGNLKNFSAENLISNLEENFHLTVFTFDSPQAKLDAKQKMLTQMNEQNQSGKCAFGIYCRNDALYLAVLKDSTAMTSAAPQMNPALSLLDISVLHKLILEKILGLNQEKIIHADLIEYVKDEPKAVDRLIEKVDNDQKQAAFFVNPVKMNQLKMVADAGEKMPQKSTFFFPKVYTGLTIHKL